METIEWLIILFAAVIGITLLVQIKLENERVPANNAIEMLNLYYLEGYKYDLQRLKKS